MSQTPAAKPVSKTAWGKNKFHTVTLPSGSVVKIKIPNLPLLAKTGRIPNPLLEVAVRSQTISDASEITPELIAEQWDYFALLVTFTVVDPELTVEEVADLPYEDIQMLVEFANRLRDVDALFKQLGGLDTVESFQDAGGV